MGNSETLVQILRRNAARKSELDADKALLTKAANEIVRLREALSKAKSKA